jgi:hypothetical protein
VTRYFQRLPAAHTVEDAIDACPPGAVPVLHACPSEAVVGCVEVASRWCGHPYAVTCGGCGERLCLTCHADGCRRCAADEEAGS